MTEDKTLEERVAALEGTVGQHGSFLYDKWAWTASAGEPQHQHGVRTPTPIRGGSRADSPLLGYDPGAAGRGACYHCGKQPQSHVCPEVKS